MSVVASPLDAFRSQAASGACATEHAPKQFSVERSVLFESAETIVLQRSS